MKKIGFIGSGNMGEAIISALIKSNSFLPEAIFASDVNKERLNLINHKYKIITTQDNISLFKNCDIIILAVKPQQLDLLLSNISDALQLSILDNKISKKLIISIAAGFTIKKIESKLYKNLSQDLKNNLPIIRSMPNTPALVLSGITGICANQYATQQDIEESKNILSKIGKVIDFSEEDLDAVTAVSGSGPAYVFYLAQNMISGAIKAGLNQEKSYELVIETLKGSIKLLEESKELPTELIRKVMSPGGTTEAAFKILQANKVEESIINAILSAKNRSKELSLI